MSETLKLRTATFGGFNRQDVVDYIESTAREHTAQLNTLRAELKDATEKLTVLEGEKARADALTERCATLTARVDELAPLEQEVETLRGQVETYRPQAESFAALKDTVANIELDARTRASQLVQEAETEAQAKRRKAEQLGDVLGVTGSGAAAAEQLPGDEGAVDIGLVRRALIEGSGPVKAEHGVGHDVVKAIPQRLRKIGQGGAGAGDVLADQQHAGHAVGQGTVQMLHQPELAVELIVQRGLQQGVPGGSVDQ